MNFEQLYEKFMEAKKALALHVSDSHDSVRSKLQSAVTARHRALGGEDSYSGYPYVADVFGDGAGGQVVYSKAGSYFRSSYSKVDKAADGNSPGYKLDDPVPVHRAYIEDSGMKEAFTEAKITPDQATAVNKYLESVTAKDSDDPQPMREALISDTIPLRESFLDSDGNGSVCYITPGAGQDGYYSPTVLKQAVSDGLFDNVPMHIDHQTEKEAAERPEQSMRTLAAKGGKAEYKESGANGAGVYAPVKAYPDYVDFLNARAADTGVSINARGKRGADVVHNGRTIPNVERLAVIKSSDFVTRAGRGGKLLQLFESFRESHRGGDEHDMANVNIDEKDLATLRESAAKVPQLQLHVDRTNERLNRYDVKEYVLDKLKESRLPESAQKRLAKKILAPESVIPTKDGVIDYAKLQESMKADIEDEITYLKESGVKLFGVRLPGADAPADPKNPDAETLKEADKLMDAEMTKLFSVANPKKGASAA